ncbi:hypothetical protein LCGC14_1973650, partial [marine sediment metagenome]
QKDAIAMYIDSDAATESAIQITGNGVVADNKAMLDVTNTAAIAAGSSLVRIHSTAASAGATAYGLEIACNASNLEALYVSLGTSRFDELIRMNGTTKIEFLDTGLYIYSSTNGQLDIVADTTVAISGAVTASSTLVVTGAVTTNATTQSTSVTTGALIDKGGLGVAKDFFLGGDLSIATGKVITTTAELTLNSVNPLTIQFGGVDWMQWDEAAISSFAGAADTAGHAVYMETEDGGADGGSATGKAGGLYSLKTGDGSAAATADQVGGAGGALTVATGDGKAANGTGTSGAGGAMTITAGVGGAESGATGTSGAGGAVVITSGAGGTQSSGTGADGGDLTLTAGVKSGSATDGVLTFVVSGVTYTWPLSVGTNGYQLTTDGTSPSNMTWAAAGSGRELKNIVGEKGNANEMLTTITNTSVYDFHYKKGRGTGDTETLYTGVMADDAPWAMHHEGGVINPINTLGYMVMGFKALVERLDKLEGK